MKRSHLWAFAVIVPLFASRALQAPMVAAAALAFSASLWKAFSVAKLTTTPVRGFWLSLEHLVSALWDATLIGFAPFALVAIATTKGSLLSIVPLLCVCAFIAPRGMPAAVLFAAAALGAWISHEPSIALTALAALSLTVALVLPSYSHPALRMSRSLALGSMISYIIGLFWHQMVDPSVLLSLVCAGVALGIISAGLKLPSLRK